MSEEPVVPTTDIVKNIWPNEGRFMQETRCLYQTRVVGRKRLVPCGIVE